MAGRIALLASGLAVLCGCGGEEPVPRAQSTPTAVATPRPAPVRPLYPMRRGCTPAGGDLRLCFSRKLYGSVHSDTGRVPVRRPKAGVVGRWVWAAASPDRRFILMQWSAECEVPVAYLVPARGGRPRPVVRGPVNSMALGWTSDGRAIVFVPAEPGCGSGEGAGLFLVTTGGKRTRIGPAARRPPIRPSVRPRNVSAL